MYIEEKVRHLHPAVSGVPLSCSDIGGLYEQDKPHESADEPTGDK